MKLKQMKKLLKELRDAKSNKRVVVTFVSEDGDSGPTKSMVPAAAKQRLSLLQHFAERTYGRGTWGRGPL